jgi:class 3 adenylate cyclase
MTADDVPDTHFASLGGDGIAYQVFGEGDIDVVLVSHTGDPIDLRWDWPPYAAFLRRLSAHGRIIMFDQRGCGASDMPSGEPVSSWEGWADDARVVLDAVGSERAAIIGHADGGPTALLFAATHPGRARGLILSTTSARYASAPDYPIGVSADAGRFVREAYGTPAMIEAVMGDAVRDPAFLRWVARSFRLSLRPRDARRVMRWQVSMDVRSALASVRVPTLVLHAEDYTTIPPAHGRYIAERINGARFVTVPGNDAILFSEPAETLRHIDQFLAELHGPTESDRALAAILFTDFVGSTKQLSAVGDTAWRNLLDSHDVIARTVVEQHSGRLIKTTGDGILATFDGPGRAIRCAIALRDALQPLGIEIRAGLHTGEVEIRTDDIAGIAVHIAARVLDTATSGELLCSAAVPMLVAGAGFEFDDRGQHELKGIDGAWQLFAVRG